jgi:hypothetical protein
VRKHAGYLDKRFDGPKQAVYNPLFPEAQAVPPLVFDGNFLNNQ